MLETKLRGVIPFLLNIACLYPLQTSAKTVNVSDLLMEIEIQDFVFN